MHWNRNAHLAQLVKVYKNQLMLKVKRSLNAHKHNVILDQLKMQEEHALHVAHTNVQLKHQPHNSVLHQLAQDKS